MVLYHVKVVFGNYNQNDYGGGVVMQGFGLVVAVFINSFP